MSTQSYNEKKLESLLALMKETYASGRELVQKLDKHDKPIMESGKPVMVEQDKFSRGTLSYAVWMRSIAYTQHKIEKCKQAISDEQAKDNSERIIEMAGRLPALRLGRDAVAVDLKKRTAEILWIEQSLQAMLDVEKQAAESPAPDMTESLVESVDAISG